MTKRQIKALQADIQDVLSLNPELSVVEKNEIPVAIKGQYIVRDDNGIPQGNFDIQVIIPQNYPNEFPILIETSKKIERKSDRHINKYGIVCEEINQLEKIIAATGITLVRYFDRYVHRYFCWQLIYEEEGNKHLEEWAHNDEGTKDFYRQYLCFNNDRLIYQFLQVVALNKAPGRNDKCLCESGRKVKHCHAKTFNELKCIDKNTLLKDSKLFS